MKVVVRTQNTNLQFRFWEDLSSNTKTITYSDFDLQLFLKAINYLETIFDGKTHPENNTKIGVSINGAPISIRFQIDKRFKFEQFKKELLAYNFKPKKTFKEELEKLISNNLPYQVILVGGVTYPQTLETPEERAEVLMYLNTDDVMQSLDESISIIADTVEELNNNEGGIIDDMQNALDRGDYD